MNGPGLVSDGPADGPDLFGPDPGVDPLAHYLPTDPDADIFAAASPAVAAKWREFVAGLTSQTQGNLASLQSYIDGHAEELGLGFRVTGDEQERAWPLNPMPIMIGAGEWAEIERGLAQRADLLEAVIADIYGPGKLLAEGHLPATVVAGSANFAPRMSGMMPQGGHFLQICAFDLARGPTGEWRVLSDRVRLPVGIGYALENRLAIGRATGGLLASIGTRRQTDFFQALRLGIAASCKRTEPRIGLLTPGRFNQSYAEQAHLARHLGFSLVEGRDLTVREGVLFVRTIAGLKRIDAVWRWISTRDIDPLNFDAGSRIGIPNLVLAAAQGLVVANWPGSGVVESRAMPAFLPRLAKEILGEPLRLPNAATWWCGGEAERELVLSQLDNLVVSSAFRRPVEGLPDGHTRAGRNLSSAERAAIEEGIRRRPMDYTAQEIVSLSTTPALVDGRFQPRGFTLRAFLARDENGNWVTLPGGFARISDHGDLRSSLMGLGDISTDVCIIDETPTGKSSASPVYEPHVQVRREYGLLPSQAADNLFWLGRYGERAHQTVRIVRSLIDQVSIAGLRLDAEFSVSRIADLLRNFQAVPKESVKWQPSRLAGVAMSDPEQAGSVLALVSAGRQIAMLLRDRLTQDSWRAIQRKLPRFIPGDLESMSHACNLLVERFAALVRLTSDGLSRGPAWRFLDLGICIERASMTLLAVRTMVPGEASSEDLSVLLDLIDGQSLYRSRYMATPYIAPVLDMVVLDPAQPRGIAYQFASIVDHLAALPALREDGMMEPQLRIARQMRARLEELEAEGLSTAIIDELRGNLAELSDVISGRYFLQEDEPVTKARTSLLT